MPGTNCPECGDRVKYGPGAVSVRCPECGEKFRVPRRGRARATNGMWSPAAVLGGLIGVAGIVLVAVLLIRGKGGGGAAGEGGAAGAAESAGDLAERYKGVRWAMTLDEVEKLLGRGRPSSDQDMLKVFVRKEGPFRGKVVWGQDPTPPERPMEWRHWETGAARVWVAFIDTRHGPLAAFDVCVVSREGGRDVNTFTNLEPGFEKRLEGEYEARMRTGEIRNDPRWVRGAKGQVLVLGEWRNENCDGMVLGGAGLMRTRSDVSQPKDPDRQPFYRFVGDNQLEITRRFYGPSEVSTYDYFVAGDELVLIDVTPKSPQNHKAQLYYRMPPKPGSYFEPKVLRPLIADTASGDQKRQGDAGWKLVRLGRYAVPALKELEQTSPEPLKSHVSRLIEAAERRAVSEEEKR